jgi:phosphoribosylanthranilate isomerase
VFVKICGITNEDDALLSVAMGADAVGFVFAPSTRQIAVLQAYDIARRLPPEVMTVGVFRDEHPSRVVETVHRAGLRAAQLHGHETPAQVAEVAKSVRWVIKAFAAGSTALRRADEYGLDIVLVDSSTPGSGTVFDWNLVDDVPEGLRIVLAGGLTPANVGAAVEKIQPWGVDVASGVEREPGRKDPMKLKAFIDAARRAAPTPYLGPDELPYDWADE